MTPMIHDLLRTPILAATQSSAALVTFLIYTLAVFGLAALSNRLLSKKSFLSEYFLGSRSLGVWAFALTFAATSASGGSFTGFPSKIYTHGWILALWIGSYMVVPICTMGFLGKRLNRVARISGSITVPDVIRDRFRSSGLGLLAVGLIVFFMSFNLVAQFKAGSEILGALLQDVPAFRSAVAFTADLKRDVGLLNLGRVDSAYLLCLVSFGVAVIIYTTWGGFHAVVWTDVMQGVVMVFGVLIMLPLAISAVGGMGNATAQMAAMTPPRVGYLELTFDEAPEKNLALVSPWISLPDEDGERPRLFRVNRSLTIPAGRRTVQNVKVVELTTPAEIERQLKRLRTEAEQRIAGFDATGLDAADGERVRRQIDAAEANGTALLFSPKLDLAEARVTLLKDYVYGADQPGVYVSGPGPVPPTLKLPDAEETSGGRQSPEAASDRPASSPGFLPLSLAISFFFMWSISGTGQPSNMVRLMAFNNTTTLRRSIFTVAVYYTAIYLPLVVIFCCARVLLPGMDLESDRIMPQMAVTLTQSIGQGWLAGLLIAAPFAAVMSTVDSFLLMISSAFVRDIYQRNINPQAPERTIKRLSYLSTLLVGTGAMLGALNPPQFLQDIIVYTGSGLAACFLAPMVYALYWPRVNTPGMLAGMLAGFAAHLSMYLAGMVVNGSFYSPYQPMNVDPILIGLAASFTTIPLVTKLTPPPPTDLVRRYFAKGGV